MESNFDTENNIKSITYTKKFDSTYDHIDKSSKTQ